MVTNALQGKGERNPRPNGYRNKRDKKRSSIFDAWGFSLRVLKQIRKNRVEPQQVSKAK